MEDVPPRYTDACPRQRIGLIMGKVAVLPITRKLTVTVLYCGFALRVVNEPLESISLDLGFNGNSLAEGLVVTTCLGGTFLGFMVSGSITDIVGRRRGFHLSALPMIIGAFLSSRTESVEGMLLGRFLVVTGMGCVGPSIASVVRYSRNWLLSLRLLLTFSHIRWLLLYRKGRSSEAEAEFEKSDRGHEPDIVKFSELFYGRHFRVVLIGSALYAFQQLSGISILLQPSLKVWGFHQTRETSA
ncbi:hypothetical protein C5167_048168 [Papaver somniferum]|uniref:Major facilitator superfamily (MFS) profile domain-containing protein n=1 Tax=Papaver somniferum TaxID=3469 RepID=A0A4Y7KIK4_PAPSO|nr:hypothetical protein C5167_048168 [Papaver somniferum]